MNVIEGDYGMSRISYINHIEEWRSDFSFKMPIKVRFSETDMFGHVNNTSPFIYFEEVRMDFLKSIGLIEEWEDSDIIPVVADMQCDYIQQVYFGEPLLIHIKIAKIGTSSMDLHYMITKEDSSICNTGRGTLVQISKTTGKSVPWSEKVTGTF